MTIKLAAVIRLAHQQLPKRFVISIEVSSLDIKVFLTTPDGTRYHIGEGETVGLRIDHAIRKALAIAGVDYSNHLGNHRSGGAP